MNMYFFSKKSFSSIDYVNEQVESGVDALMIFDTWGGLLSKDNYAKYSLNYIREIISNIKSNKIPIIYYSRSKSNFEELKEILDDIII